MKKLIFGLTLIIFSMILILLDEVVHVSMFRNDFVAFIYIILPFIGLGMSVWGLIEKENKKQ